MIKLSCRKDLFSYFQEETLKHLFVDEISKLKIFLLFYNLLEFYRI